MGAFHPSWWIKVLWKGLYNKNWQKTWKFASAHAKKNDFFAEGGGLPLCRRIFCTHFVELLASPLYVKCHVCLLFLMNLQQKKEKILKVFVMFVSMLKDGMVLEKQRQKQSNRSSFKMSENNCKNTEWPSKFLF